MQINIYYGGRGLIEDPTIYAMNKIEKVLQELRVDVKRYNLFEEKNNILVLPKTLKEADGIILATSLEWLGMGGFMQQFLDACWLYADKKKLEKVYMMPLVIASTQGEREVVENLVKAWEILGGIPYKGISAYVENYVDFETNSEYKKIIENQTENFYRAVNKKEMPLPSSNSVLRTGILKPSAADLTPQESEQLSVYVSDEGYVKKQKEDIEELTQIFKGMLDRGEGDFEENVLRSFRSKFQGKKGLEKTLSVNIEDISKTLIVKVKNFKIDVYYGSEEEVDILIKASKGVVNNLILGRTTFQGAFMSGELTAKGEFKALRELDEVFDFDIL